MIKRSVSKFVMKIFMLFSDMLYNKISRDSAIRSFQNINLHCNDPIINSKFRNQKVIVSLTSFSTRVNDVYLTIESIGRQSILPNKIILWLSEDEYDNSKLPVALERLMKRGLEVKFCKNLRSYKKLIPTLVEYPNDLVITVDDDIIYDFNLVELLLAEHIKNPNSICCMDGRLISGRKGRIDNYSEWQYSFDQIGPSHDIIGIGFGGILYFPGCFHSDIAKEELFMDLSPLADDLWFKVMAFLNNTKYKLVSNKNPSYKNIVLQSSDLDSLAKFNVIGNNNDTQFRKLLNHYSIEINEIIGN